MAAGPVPASEVSLTLNTDSLLDLPAGASYHARSGRANVDVSKGKEPGTIVVYASCDSLQRLVCYYERLAGEYKASLERQSEEVKEEKNDKMALSVEELREMSVSELKLEKDIVYSQRYLK